MCCVVAYLRKEAGCRLSEIGDLTGEAGEAGGAPDDNTDHHEEESVPQRLC